MATQFIIIALTAFSICSAFILDAKHPSAYITVKEFRDLMDLVFEEKHYRRSLEHTVAGMQQEADNNGIAMTHLGHDYHVLSQVYRHLLDSHAEVLNGLRNLRQVNQSIQITLSNTTFDTASLKQKQGYASAFTATSPSSTGYQGANAIFSSVLTNIGSDYSASTGAFTCQYPGIYVFTAHLYNTPSSSYDYVSCYISLNGSTRICIYSHPYSDTRYYEASNSLTVHLNHGDVVAISSCSSNTGLYSYSSFSGYLLKAD